jgi:hypothetical protein
MGRSGRESLTKATARGTILPMSLPRRAHKIARGRLVILVTDAEREELQRAAMASKLQLGTWARVVLLTAAERKKDAP